MIVAYVNIYAGDIEFIYVCNLVHCYSCYFCRLHFFLFTLLCVMCLLLPIVVNNVVYIYLYTNVIFLRINANFCVFWIVWGAFLVIMSKPVCTIFRPVYRWSHVLVTLTWRGGTNQLEHVILHENKSLPVGLCGLQFFCKSRLNSENSKTLHLHTGLLH